MYTLTSRVGRVREKTCQKQTQNESAAATLGRGLGSFHEESADAGYLASAAIPQMQLRSQLLLPQLHTTPFPPPWYAQRREVQ